MLVKYEDVILERVCDPPCGESLTPHCFLINILYSFRVLIDLGWFCMYTPTNKKKKIENWNKTLT